MARIRQGLASFVFSLIGAVVLLAQGTDLGTIRGTVTDPTGAVVPNAAVEVVDVATSLSRKLTTDSAGNYEASGLRSGAYKVTVNAAGFSTAEIVNIALQPGGVARADAGLKPKGTTEVVVVTSEAPLVQTESPTVSATLNNQALLALPRDNRDIYSFLYLNPNITQADSDGSYKFLGSQSYGASFSLDGQRSNGGVFGQPTASQPSLETIGELTVLSNNFTAEFAGIANIRVSTRRGASLYHGSLFHNNKNSALAAWDLRDKVAQNAFLPTAAISKYPTPYFNLNELGGSFGGPVPKIRNTYFFAAFERRWQNSPVNLRVNNLPHPALWSGDFSRLADNRKPVVPANVQLTAAEIGSDTVGGQGARFIRIPQRLLNPTTGALIQKYFPQVNPAAPINATNG
ncbi:MAG: carboxypeptidase regulatory-like domain-containing protein, partial [Acidobacteria bacterium]|nr:carboxypeptidase regulatory-like domain-containing protein [Acidobacteriota bacterium]